MNNRNVSSIVVRDSGPRPVEDNEGIEVVFYDDLDPELLEEVQVTFSGS